MSFSCGIHINVIEMKKKEIYISIYSVKAGGKKEARCSEWTGPGLTIISFIFCSVMKSKVKIREHSPYFTVEQSTPNVVKKYSVHTLWGTNNFLGDIHPAQLVPFPFSPWSPLNISPNPHDQSLRIVPLLSLVASISASSSYLPCCSISGG
jgi:hypothetical protein